MGIMINYLLALGRLSTYQRLWPMRWENHKRIPFPPPFSYRFTQNAYSETFGGGGKKNGPSLGAVL